MDPQIHRPQNLWTSDFLLECRIADMIHRTHHMPRKKEEPSGINDPLNISVIKPTTGRNTGKALHLNKLFTSFYTSKPRKVSRQIPFFLQISLDLCLSDRSCRNRWDIFLGFQ
jgi:hypothetical protein